MGVSVVLVRRSVFAVVSSPRKRMAEAPSDAAVCHAVAGEEALSATMLRRRSLPRKSSRVPGPAYRIGAEARSGAMAAA